MSKMTKDSCNDAMRENFARDSDLESCNLDASSCLFESLNEKDQQESELLRMLNFELSEFIELVKKQDFSAIDRRRKLLSCFFERIVGQLYFLFSLYFYNIPLAIVELGTFKYSAEFGESSLPAEKFGMQYR